MLFEKEDFNFINHLKTQDFCSNLPNKIDKNPCNIFIKNQLKLNGLQTQDSLKKLKYLENFHYKIIAEKGGKRFYDEKPKVDTIISFKNLEKSDEAARVLKGLIDHSTSFSEKNAKLNETIALSLTIGNDFFFEIARLRALNLLTFFIKAKNNLPSNKTLLIKAITEYYNNENYAPYEEIISSNIKIMASLIGNADLIEKEKTENSFIKELYDNIPYILKQEARFSYTIDPLAGSYFIENYTHILAQEIFENLKKITSQFEGYSFHDVENWYTDIKDSLPKKETTKPDNSLTLNSWYDKKDIKNLPFQNSLPGFPPYLRGPYQSMYCGKPWTIRQYAGFSTAEESNKFYRNNLKRGQKGLSIAFDLPTHRGYDSDNPVVSGDIGQAGVAIDSVEDMKILFNDIPLDEMTVSMTMNGAVIPIMAFYIVAAEEQGVSPQQLKGTIQNDILKEFMVRNTYIYPPAESMRIVSDIFKYTSVNMPQFNAISVSGYHMHEAGATAELELAYTLADGLEYIKTGLNAGMDIDDFAPRITFFWGIGMHHFTEVAKMRAARVLWADIVRRFNPKNPKSLALRTHSQTSGYSLTAQKPYNNISRTITEALAATMGGTQSLHTNALDEALALPSEETATIARNTQRFMQNETGITKTIDPYGGSYYVENLTGQLIIKAKKLIDEIEEEGGMTKAIEKGIPKRKIEEAAARKQASIDTGQEIIIGINDRKKQTDNSKKLELLRVDNEKVKEDQCKKIDKLKNSRNTKKVNETLDLITEVAEKGNSNLLEIAVKAARQRATLQEISDAMEKAFGRHQAKDIIVSNIYSSQSGNNKDIQKARSLAEYFAEKYGRRPRIMAAKIGQDGHDRGIKVIASAFSDMGFDVDLAPLFQSPEQVAKQAMESDVHIIGISSLAGGHKSLIPQLKKALKKYDSEDIMLIIGGIIPEDDYEELYNLGVSKIFGPGTIISKAAVDIIEMLMDKNQGNNKS